MQVLDEKTIKLIFELSLKYGVRQVAKILNQRGIKTKNGSVIHKITIQEILKKDFDFIPFDLKRKVQEAKKERLKKAFKGVAPDIVLSYWCPKYDCHFVDPKTCFYQIIRKNCIQDCIVGQKLVQKFKDEFKKVRQKTEKTFISQIPKEILKEFSSPEILFSDIEDEISRI
ncbi:MAG TPA: hypothetical protein ENG63_07005 [Candidatus Desulfofervidus auxilii]|uniref:Recombinase domain-containing protein n=1 Tax=Desulfofervidus auxilii TaxID=1621989 RepID=A0A7C0Y639_DESA2|nr:hypothetical protein [Candidatus Desulfofervidus auxilii]